MVTTTSQNTTTPTTTSPRTKPCLWATLAKTTTQTVRTMQVLAQTHQTMNLQHPRLWEPTSLIPTPVASTVEKATMCLPSMFRQITTLKLN